MIKLNFPQKNRAEQGAVISEEKQTLLSKRREKLQSKLSQAGCYIELRLINKFMQFEQKKTGCSDHLLEELKLRTTKRWSLIKI